MRRALLIPGKAPRPRRTKTRLSPPLSPEQAADLYRGFLQDAVGMGLSLGWERVSVIYPPEPQSREELETFLPPGATLRPQEGDGLGAALAGAFRSHLEEGFCRVVLVGSDNPTVPPSLAEAACGALGDHDLVIGPTADGGYYLLAMAAFHPAVFARIAWSTEEVFAQTLARAQAQGLRVHKLAEWYDVDTVADLRRLQHDLAELPSTTAPATRRALGRIAPLVSP